MTIGVMARNTGCKVETIRYYERIGLLDEPLRSAGGHRHYGHAHLKRLSFIRRARDLGFPLDTVRALLGLSAPGDATCAEVEGLAAGHLAEVRAKIADLARLEAVLAELVARCRGGTVPECPIIEALYTEGPGPGPGGGRGAAQGGKR
jgi:MerR family mercuric resistance operon transcriptional regulator